MSGDGVYLVQGTNAAFQLRNMIWEYATYSDKLIVPLQIARRSNRFYAHERLLRETFNSRWFHRTDRPETRLAARTLTAILMTCRLFRDDQNTNFTFYRVCCRLFYMSIYSFLPLTLAGQYICIHYVGRICGLHSCHHPRQTRGHPSYSLGRLSS